MLKDWDSKRAYSVMLKTKEIYGGQHSVRFSYMGDYELVNLRKPIRTGDFPYEVKTETYDAEVQHIARMDRGARQDVNIALDRESQEIVDLFVELEHNRLQAVISNYRGESARLKHDMKKLQNEIDNFITWKNVKQYLTRLLR